MVPAKQKKERKYVPPSFIDEEFIKTLPAEKQEYWANRILGHPGQGKKVKAKVTAPESGGITRFDNDGNMVVTNRAARRQRPVTPSYYTSSTHSQKKLRGQIK